MKLIKLSQAGIAHWLVPALVMAMVGVVGARVLTATHAASLPSSLNTTSNTYKNGKIFSGNYSINSNGTGIKLINNAASVDGQTTSASFDGSQIAFIGDPNFNYIDKADVPFAHQKTVATPPSTNNYFGPVWSPNGNWIASAYRDPADPSGWGVWLVKTNGTDSHTLSNFPKAPFNSYISWMPNSNSIMYTPYGDGSAAESKICTININGTDNTCVPIQIGNVVVGSVLGVSGLSVSPNGQEIALGAYNNTGITGTQPSADIYTINKDGSGLKRLTDFPVGEQVTDVVWSPDNTKIAYVLVGQGSESNVSGVYLMNADGSYASLLPDIGVYSNSLTWAHK